MGGEIDGCKGAETLSVEDDIRVVCDALTHPVQDVACVVVELPFARGASGVTKARVIEDDDVGGEIGGEETHEIDALAGKGSCAGVSMKEDDDTLFGGGEEGVEMRVCTVDKGGTGGEDVPAAKMLVLDETSGGSEAVGLEVVEGVEGGWGADPMEEDYEGLSAMGNGEDEKEEDIKQENEGKNCLDAGD